MTNNSDKVFLRLMRQRLGMSTIEMGNELDCSDRFIRNWEQGIAPVRKGVRQELKDLVSGYYNAVDALSVVGTPTTVQIYRGVVKGNTEQCPPNTWLNIVAEACEENHNLTALYPEDGEADLKPMPTPLKDLASKIDNLSGG